ncbi:MAG: hypothetical protein EXR09_01505 [Acetobacteraceae bacterium]|nr:hypothetical protein [Acetobacteraceae bacterium]
MKVLLGILVIGGGFTGWVLGIEGFARASTVRDELAALRRGFAVGRVALTVPEPTKPPPFGTSRADPLMVLPHRPPTVAQPASRPRSDADRLWGGVSPLYWARAGLTLRSPRRAIGVEETRRQP